jgi:cardiolipin synthase
VSQVARRSLWVLGPVLLISAAGCGVWPPPMPDTVPAGAPVPIFTEPEAGRQTVLALIESAHASLWMEMYLLTDEGAITALTERAAAGADVRVILEPSPYGDGDGNQTAYARLSAAGVDVRWATARFTYTHAKMFTLDHARLAILTLNLTRDGLSGNREYGAIDDDPTDVAAAEAIFAADQVGAVAAIATPGRVVSSPESTRPALLELIDGAQTTLALETEELADSQIVAALLGARGRGVAVTVVWPGPAAGAGAPFTTLAAAGAEVRASAAPPIHGKVLVADARTVYLGSANLTATSLDDNRELGLRLAQPDTAGTIGAVVASDAAGGTAP